MSAQLSMFGEAAPPSRRPALTRKQARDRGMARAIDHANEVDVNWGDVAFAALQVYVAGLPTGRRLTGEMIRQHAEAVLAVRNPPDKRAWGMVLRHAARAGLIRKVGWTTAADPKVHCNPISEWVRA